MLKYCHQFTKRIFQQFEILDSALASVREIAPNLVVVLHRFGWAVSRERHRGRWVIGTADESAFADTLYDGLECVLESGFVRYFQDPVLNVSPA